MKDKISGIVVAVATAALLGGFTWVQEIGTRVAIIEDDLSETVEVISLLHPPQRAATTGPPKTFHTSDQQQQRRSKLEQLKEQCETPPEQSGDDDDSAAPQLNT